MNSQKTPFQNDNNLCDSTCSLSVGQFNVVIDASMIFLTSLLDDLIIISITTKVHHNKRKLTIHWSSQIPKRYKRNAITSDLNRTVCMASVPEMKSQILNVKFLMLAIHLDSSILSLNNLVKI